MADDKTESKTQSIPSKTAKTSPIGFTHEPPKVESSVDFIGILGDIRSLIAAYKAGDWFGEDGIVAVIQRMLGRIKVGGSDDVPKFSSGGVPGVEFDKAVNEFRRETLGVMVMRGGMTALPPEIRDALIELAKKLVNVFFDWWTKRQTDNV